MEAQMANTLEQRRDDLRNTRKRNISFNSSSFWFNSRSFSEIRSFSLLFEALFDCYAGSISVFTVSELASTVVDEVICFSSTCFLLGFQKLMVLIIFSGSSFTL